MAMMLFRCAREADLAAIYQLAEQGGIGITTLPKDIELLKRRLLLSLISLHKPVNSPGDEYYLFVLEDPSSGHVVGTSAIKASVGYDAPFYSYKLSKRTRMCHALNIRNDYEVLSLVNDNQGHSEICTLFLDPTYRQNSNGLLLSRARFLFIGEFQNRFSETIIAELRGISDEEGHAPFWDQIGHHFFHMTFVEADRLTLSTDKQFIADLMPRNPIYVQLLSQETQAVIGKPHPSTVPAMHILLKEGFHYNHYVDIFDAGPTIEAPREGIKSIASSTRLTINTIIDEVNSKRFIVANTSLDFRATVCQIAVAKQEGSCIISRETAQLLHVKCGDCLRVTPL